MNSPEFDLATELAELSATLNVALARIQTLASDPAHVIRREALVMDVLKATGPKVSGALRTLAERLETAACDSVTFPNRKCGIESVVRPASSGYAVMLRDTDSDRTLPTVHRFANRDEAIAKARHLVGVWYLGPAAAYLDRVGWIRFGDSHATLALDATPAIR